MTVPRLTLDLTEWQDLLPEPDSETYGTALSSADARAAAAELTRWGLLGIQELRTGLRVQATSFVGRIYIGDVQVTIRPKIEQMRVMRLLRYAYGLRNLRLYEPVGFNVTEETFPDLLVRQLAAEVGELLARGLRRGYLRIDEELGSPRGRISLQKLGREGGTITATLPCTHFPRSDDTLLNRVLRAGLSLGMKLTGDPALRVTLNRLASIMDEGVSAIRLDLGVIDRTSRALTRLSSAYAPALTLIRMLLEGEGVSLEGEDGVVHVPGYLFDMNRLFQAVLSRFLRENLAGYVVRDEYRLQGMLTHDPQHNPWKRPAPTPRPDYAVLKGATVVGLLDAKYMDLWERKGIGSDALYQLALYALSQPAGVSTILYPATDPGAREARINIADPVYGAQRAQVIARPVHLDRLESYLSDSVGVVATRDRMQYAHKLAFG